MRAAQLLVSSPTRTDTVAPCKRCAKRGGRALVAYASLKLLIDCAVPFLDLTVILATRQKGIFTQTAEHAPPRTHGRRKVSVYIPGS